MSSSESESEGILNRTLISLDFDGDESIFVLLAAVRLRNRGGDSGGLRIGSGDNGGIGIVGMEYSLGNTYEDPEEGCLLCRDANRCGPNRVVRRGGGGGESFEEIDDEGETPLIFDNNYSQSTTHTKAIVYLFIFPF